MFMGPASCSGVKGFFGGLGIYGFGGFRVCTGLSVASRPLCLGFGV